MNFGELKMSVTIRLIYPDAPSAFKNGFLLILILTYALKHKFLTSSQLHRTVLCIFSSGGEEAPEDDAESNDDKEPAERIDRRRNEYDGAGWKTKWIYQVGENNRDGDVKNGELQPFAKGISTCEEENNRDDGEHLTEKDEWETKSV